MKISPELNLVIFTCEKYKDMLPVVLEGLKNIKDPIASKTIVSPNRVNISGFNHISDRDFWSRFDPQFKHIALYRKTWYRQQILKLSVDHLHMPGSNYLILDGDVAITQPMQFIESDKFVFYLAGEFHRGFFNCIKTLTGLKKVVPSSFIAEAMVFNTTILESLKNYIRDYTRMPDWLSAVEKDLQSSLNGPLFLSNHFLSEFELYGTFIYQWYPDLVAKLIDPCSQGLHLPVMPIHDWKNKSSAEIYKNIQAKCPHCFQAFLFK
jgi:hypothetical protein